MEKSELIKNIFSLVSNKNIRYYIFTSENYKICIIFHKYYHVFHDFVYNKKTETI